MAHQPNKSIADCISVYIADIDSDGLARMIAVSLVPRSICYLSNFKSALCW